MLTYDLQDLCRGIPINMYFFLDICVYIYEAYMCLILEEILKAKWLDFQAEAE